MAITKEIVEDKIEVVGDYKNIQVRTATVIKEGTDAKGYTELSRSFHRKVLECVTSSYDGSTWTHTDTDISEESKEVQAICNAVWTTDIKNAKKAANESASF
tara:strand:+ start:508 stop:813 length:306 start_codon:yes stop_codon:yes gene_type:complete